MASLYDVPTPEVSRYIRDLIDREKQQATRPSAEDFRQTFIKFPEHQDFIRKVFIIWSLMRGLNFGSLEYYVTYPEIIAAMYHVERVEGLLQGVQEQNG